MSSILNKFQCLNGFFDKDVVHRIHVFSHNFGLCVTANDEVYALGKDVHKYLEYLDENQINYTLITELSGEQVSEFFGCDSDLLFFAVTAKREVYSFGYNGMGCLALGYASDESLRPQKCDFGDKFIADIRPGMTHCLALTTDNQVIGWGWSDHGQLAIDHSIDVFPGYRLIDLSARIIQIDTAFNTCLAVDEQGLVYLWGKISKKQNQVTPKVINMQDVVRKSLLLFSNTENLNYQFSIAILTNVNLVKIVDVENEHVQFVFDCNAVDIMIYYEHTLARFYIKTMSWIYNVNVANNYELDNCELLSWIELYTQKLGFTLQNIFKNEQGLFCNKLGESLMNMSTCFNVIEKIGEGNFGIVFKVTDKNTKINYAVKKHRLTDFSQIDRELEMVCQLKSQYIVEYYSSWTEEKKDEEDQLDRYLYIQMECCLYNLRHFFTLIHRDKNLIQEEYREYYLEIKFLLFTKIMVELTQAVNYLHTRSPPVIHRDLKPENILIAHTKTDNSLKLCDFGLAKIHEKSYHTRRTGTLEYMAPEVLTNDVYNPMCDVYSLALIATEIYNFGTTVEMIKKEVSLDKYIQPFIGTNLEKCYTFLVELLSRCLLSVDYHERPNCQTILEQLDQITSLMKETLVARFEKHSDLVEITKQIMTDCKSLRDRT